MMRTDHGLYECVTAEYIQEILHSLLLCSLLTFVHLEIMCIHLSTVDCNMQAYFDVHKLLHF